ncbi:hypothetical protein OG568_60960 (plasmid) [Streptomyces sp. NBC_01450]|uniref:hypothetical protein n=1 Tax=Streptomyces sp. NBC_01450 TaxID=2903871 RepID=UPI002E30EBCF|nr:hypothetical protein [Streptomyces sp. NBC_01450]
MFRQERRADRSTPRAPKTPRPAKSGKARNGDKDDVSGSGLWHVLIAVDGTVTVNGDVIATATGGAARTTALDHLHRRAVALARPVEASVLDEQRRATLRIRVQQDGASELLGDPIPFDKPKAAPAAPSPPVPTPAPGPGTAPSPGSGPRLGPGPIPAPEPGPASGSAPGLAPIPASGSLPEPGAGPVPAPPQAGGPRQPERPVDVTAEPYMDSATTVLKPVRVPPALRRTVPAPVVTEPSVPGAPPAPARSTRADGPDAPPAAEGHTAPPVGAPPIAASVPNDLATAPVTVPDELAANVALICETIAGGDLALAKIQASALERQAVHHFGRDHLYALEARSLEAYVAHLTGDHGTAAALALRVAEVRHRQGDVRAREDVERAFYSWELVLSPLQSVPLGRRLLPLWNAISAAEGTERYKAAERRMSALTQVTPPSFAASLVLP